MNPMEEGGSLPATQADIGRLAMDIGRLETGIGRIDAKLDSSVRRLAKEIVEIKTELGDLKNVVATKTDIRRLVDAVEGFSGKAQSYDAAKTLHGQALTDVQVRIKDHELRIKGLDDRPH
jgi:hypothetical protein